MNNDGLNTNRHHYLKEAETGVITLPDDDPEIVKLMIDYFYTLDYSPSSGLRIAKGKKQVVPAGKEPVESPQGPDGTSHLITLAKMYAIADKYDIKGLQSLSRDKFKLAAANNWNHCDLPLAIYAVYTSTPDSNMGLRDIVVNLISDHMSLMRKPEVEAVVRESNGLAFDLLKLKHLSSSGVWR